MGRRGRLPEPTALKRAKGNPGKRPLNDEEPEPRIEIPKAPPHLSPFSKREWRRITPLLAQLGLLSSLDRTALAIYCQAYGRWKKAEREVKKTGEIETVTSKSGAVYLQQSPWLQISNKAVDQMHKMLAEFGLSPAARSRIRAKPLKEMTEHEKLMAQIFGELDQAGVPTGKRASA